MGTCVSLIQDSMFAKGYLVYITINMFPFGLRSKGQQESGININAIQKWEHVCLLFRTECLPKECSLHYIFPFGLRSKSQQESEFTLDKHQR